MPAIGHVTKSQDGNYKGALRTLALSAPVTILQNTSKTGDTQPDYRVFSNNIEIGAGWIKKSKSSGQDFVSLSFSDPSFGKLYANLGQAAGQDDENVFAIIWNPAD